MQNRQGVRLILISNRVPGNHLQIELPKADHPVFDIILFTWLLSRACYLISERMPALASDWKVMRALCKRRVERAKGRI
jgi:hypothetical protein